VTRWRTPAASDDVSLAISFFEMISEIVVLERRSSTAVIWSSPAPAMTSTLSPPPTGWSTASIWVVSPAVTVTCSVLFSTNPS
jgi:hypothetical protein